MKRYTLTLLAFLAVTTACNDEDFLNREPTNILLNDQIFEDERLVVSVLADLYDRYPDLQSVSSWWEFVNYDDAFGSFVADYWRDQHLDFDYNWWNYWDYAYIREINLFIERCDASTGLSDEAKERFLGEGRFLRAAIYFELTKRMGGVPLITESMVYDFSGDPSYLQFPRAKEHEVYDFVISELEAVKDVLPDDPSIKSRATRGLALALEARAALYAGSIAKYGQTTPQVALPGEEVGIPASRAQEYYEIALRSAEAVSGYSLYQKDANLSQNFTNLFLDKSNPEVIFVEDYKLKSGKTHDFTVLNQPLSLSEEGANLGGRFNPSLNLVQSFELLDNTYAPFATTDAGGNPIYYDNQEDIFQGRDARLAGTVIYPGGTFRGEKVDIWAGLLLSNGTKVTADAPGALRDVEGTQVKVVGDDGPINNYEGTAQTGFLIRKFLDPTPGAGQIGTQSAVWWIRFRYAEVLLNAAEAAFELGQADKAVGYLNQVRARAGLTTPLTAADMTFDRIVHERQVELAFEDHRLWDLRRWRLAHKVWDGSTQLPDDIGKADEPSAMVYGLWPYKVYNPGGSNDGKWVYEVVKPDPVRSAHRFRLGNYYSSIDNNIINNNPKIVRNPNQ
ncbi:Starch-binding associating with outer membrane [Catalinimonas alkaloidigena]|uniref:Starch-binding associating with outer membrane n=1 Tax=Catalinimonas alkaloidigena TaxID=1075417 RepID=A0A1G9A4W3_9BACT|nr:RagB/SusD family nutrient uptake outer membrane protein [Catalinimonas alkaloidigena]SDK22338.1 Starch-binding associating with outer membrane [Catalinimonas alkaloidigena]